MPRFFLDASSRFTMPAPEHPTDPHGFRVPQRFDDSAAVPPAPDRFRRQLQAMVSVVLTIAAGLLLFRSELADTGREAMANYYLNRARPHILQQDYNAALVEVDRAIEWHDKGINLYQMRSQLHGKLKQFDAAVADLTAAMEKLPTDDKSQRRELLIERSVMYQRQRKQTEALADLDQAYNIRSAKNSTLLNNRAYARAVFNVEIEGALKDIKQAIEWADRAPNASFIDTRGYVYFRLKRYDEALKDIEQAIELTEAERVEDIARMEALKSPTYVREQVLKSYDESLAVMYHHRGEIHEQLGNKTQAEADMKKAKEMGYDREAGVF
ncbi:MAG: tetratricopeptide repeat protein [Planctomycetaceae bacterium]|nr:tetratricopeptide repeat protein [Planctomycetaceae bacterium]